MSKKIPKFVAEQYGGSHAFRRDKRKLAQIIDNAIHDLSIACAYFPSGAKDVSDMRKIIKRIRADISVKNWGQ